MKYLQTQAVCEILSDNQRVTVIGGVIFGILICYVLVALLFLYIITHVFSSIHPTCRAATPNSTLTAYPPTLVSCSACKTHILMPLIIICENDDVKTSHFHTVRESKSVHPDHSSVIKSYHTSERLSCRAADSAINPTLSHTG